MRHPFNSKPWYLLASAFAAFLIGCASVSLAGDFTIKDSGRRVAQFSKLFWLDNQRVLFQGPDGTFLDRRDGFKQALYRLYVWDSQSGEITEGVRVGGGLCYKDGFVRYWRWKIKEGEYPTQAEWFAGPYGAETRVERSVTDPDNFNWETCKPFSELPPRPEWTRGLAVRWLRPEDGLLVLGSAAIAEVMKNTPIKYCPGGEQAHCIDLPLKQRESRGFEWVPFKRAYFVVANYFQVDRRHPRGGFNRVPWPKELPMPLWWLYPDGRIEKVELPPGLWLRNFVYPAWAGMVTIGQGPTRWEHSLYLVRDNGGTAILHGLFNAETVAPNGCKIAVDHDPKPLETNWRNNRHVTLKIVELCQGR